jgi:hypothetical protein
MDVEDFDVQLSELKETLTLQIEDIFDLISSYSNYDYRTLNLSLIRCLELLNQIEALEQRKFALEYIDDFYQSVIH